MGASAAARGAPPKEKAMGAHAAAIGPRMGRHHPQVPRPHFPGVRGGGFQPPAQLPAGGEIGSCLRGYVAVHRLRQPGLQKFARLQRIPQCTTGPYAQLERRF